MFSFGGMKINEKILTFIITWILTRGGSNPVVLNEGDLSLLYGILKGVKFNWI